MLHFSKHFNSWVNLSSIYLGDAAYVAANHRTYLPILLLAGLISIVLVIYLLLFRKFKPYHSIETASDNVGNGDVVELVGADNSQDIVEPEVTSL